MRTTGTVTWFNDSKGYGYIETKSLKDIFCHYLSIHGETFKTLSSGQIVEFDLEQGQKGPIARNIMKTGERVDSCCDNEENIFDNEDEQVICRECRDHACMVECKVCGEQIGTNCCTAAGVI